MRGQSNWGIRNDIFSSALMFLLIFLINQGWQRGETGEAWTNNPSKLPALFANTLETAQSIHAIMGYRYTKGLYFLYL